MRFDTIIGDAFGPFRNDELELGPRLTIVHGLNESGKSSWAAALYASLAGRRRSRGRGSKEDAQFRARHKPWSGSRWKVTARITTDDGTRLAVAQDLGQGTTRIHDLETSRALTPRELQTRFGIPPSTSDDIDVGQLFGLSRGTLRATTFVPQAEVLRVVEQADELQQFLQRAASNQTVDVTAHQVIDRLRDELATRVGSPSVGQRPLRSATHQLQLADERAYRLRAARDELRQVAVQLRLHAEDEASARSELSELDALQGWAELDSLETRVAKVHAFEAELESLASLPEPAPAELREQVHAARTAYVTLGEPPTTPAGPDTAELERQLAELPEAPTGDTTPDPQVRDLWEQLSRSVSALASHERPDEPAGEDTLPDVASDELRHLADKLHRERDYEARVAAHRVARAAWEVRQRTRSGRRAEERTSRTAGWWQLVLGVLLLGLGAGLVFVEPVVGALLAIVGGALAVWGLLARVRPGHDTAPQEEHEAERPQPPSPPSPPRPPTVASPGARPVEPVLSPRIDEIGARRQRWREEAAAYDNARAEVLTELSTRELPTDPDRLQALARRLDEREGARKAAEQRLADEVRLQAEVSTTTRRLTEALAARGEDVGAVSNPESADEAYRRYEENCQERAAVARLAARREDLEKALAARRSEEDAYRKAAERQDFSRAALVTSVQGLHLDPGEDPDLAATLAASWLEEQAQADEGMQRRAQLTSLRDQLLDGATLKELIARAEVLRGQLGPRPERPVPDDLEQAVGEAARQVETAATRRASTEGRLASLRAEEQDLAIAIEEAAHRRAELLAVQELRATMELAIEHLEAAQTEAHRSLAPVLESAMRRRIPLVTNGRYRDVRVQPEDLTVELQERTGAWRNAAYLSQGTTEQTYLLLRLALVEHLDTRETMPLVLDDVTVQCDRHRTVALLALLREIARERQVIVFSQESGVLEWARDNLDEASGDRLVTLTTT